MGLRNRENEKLSIAMISTWRQRCGIADYSENLANALAKQGVNVYVVRIPRFGYKDASVFQNIVDAIPIEKVQIIHVQHEYGLYSGFDKNFFPTLKKLGKPIVTTMHSVGNWDADTIIATVSNRVIVHNEFCHRRFGAIGPVCVIPHGMTPLQTPLPPREVCRRHLGIQQEVPVVGYLGFISSYKGLESLIEAMVKVPNAALLIGGGWIIEQETEYIINLKERASKLLPNRCQWLGYVPDDDVDMVYGAMNIVVYPSRFMTESGALLKALSHGKAVIASDLAPVREKAKQGVLMTFKDVNDLTKKIKHLIADAELRQKFEEAATKFAEENSWANVARKHVELYESVVADTAHATNLNNVTLL
jgi:glycosyltransferase involved in cell wall biosynthesis